MKKCNTELEAQLYERAIDLINKIKYISFQENQIIMDLEEVDIKLSRVINKGNTLKILIKENEKMFNRKLRNIIIIEIENLYNKISNYPDIKKNLANLK